MILKIFKAVWFLSLLALMTSFLFIYASVPEKLVVHEGEGLRTISREGLFYGALALFAVCNVLVFIIPRLFARSTEDFLCWFHGLIISLNIFFIISLNFINLYNSSEKFDYSHVGYVIYGSLGLVILWTVSWPFYALARKKMNKPTV
jgi:hypothetical protein